MAQLPQQIKVEPHPPVALFLLALQDVSQDRLPAIIGRRFPLHSAGVLAHVADLRGRRSIWDIDDLDCEVDLVLAHGVLYCDCVDTFIFLLCPFDCKDAAVFGGLHPDPALSLTQQLLIKHPLLISTSIFWGIRVWPS